MRTKGHLLSLGFTAIYATFSVLGQVVFDSQTEPTYDYVIIGGGTGGLAVASRLSENPSVSVLVIEAGPYVEDLPEVFIPGFIGRGQAFTTLNWAYRTTPQTNLNGRQVTVNAGKALGGSSVINAMIFVRAQREQYNAWSQLAQSSLWGWDAVLPYFKKSELFRPPDEFQVDQGAAKFLPDLHGLATGVNANNEGRVKVGFPNFFFDQSTWWINNVAGVSPSPDLGDGDVVGHVGVSPNALDSTNNTRCTSACAYYVPFRDRPNFTVLTNSSAVRILWTHPISPATPGPLVAAGVEYVDAQGVVQRVNVRKEAILAAGTIGSPKIMELSGVGNVTILRNAGVQPILEFPTVGENLADHVHSWVNAFTNATVLTKDILLSNQQFADQQVTLWQTNRTGLYSAAPRALSIAAPSDVFTGGQQQALLQQARDDVTKYATQFSNGNADLKQGIEAQYGLMLGLYEQQKAGVLEINFEPGYSGPTSFPSRPARNFSTINTVLYYPFARGRTHISSTNYTVPPLVDPAYWAHPLDVAGHVAGMQLGRKQLKDTPLLSTIYQGEFEPGVAAPGTPGSDQAVEAYGRAVVASDNHETGSMGMMPKELGGVVDEKLRVYGISNVRVADASIIPMPISAHLMATVYMIGERAADFIKETWTN